MEGRKALRWILSRSKKQTIGILVVSILQAFSALLGIGLALAGRQVIDNAVNGGHGFTHVAALLMAVVLAQILVLAGSRFLSITVQTRLDISLKQKLFETILHRDYAAISAYHSGYLMSRINSDVRIVSSGMVELAPSVFGMLTRLTAAFLALYTIDRTLALVILIAGLGVFLGVGFFRKKMKLLSRREQEASERVTGFMQETLGNLLMLKTFRAEELAAKSAAERQKTKFQAAMARRNYTTLTVSGVNALFHLGYAFGLLWCALSLSRGLITIGTITAVLQLIGQLQSPLTGLSGIVPRLSAMLASIDRILEIEALPAERRLNETELKPSALYDRLIQIEFSKVCFRYDRERVLHDAEFSLKKGEFAVLSGLSGIGKTTVLKLLLGVYLPNSGSVHFRTAEGDIPADCMTRRLFAYVPQGNFLLSGTLRESLCMLNQNATDAEIEEALTVSCSDFVADLPEGLSTVVGEKGYGLSEGQAQRLAIARAVLGGAPILLLDEATSALDEATERRVLENIRALRAKTCLIISHKQAAYDICDAVIEIRDGAIWKREL